MQNFLPTPPEVRECLGVSYELYDLLKSSLLSPLEEFLLRPKKSIRAKLVRVGWWLGKGEPLNEKEEELCQKASEIVEAFHAGSLLVDDIEDNSHERRGGATVHRIHGVPIALNAGNWLYFWPFERVRAWGLKPDQEVRVHHLFHGTLLKAHFGQAIDIGSPIDQIEKNRVKEVCLASLELKTGALMAMAVGLGGVLAGGDEQTVERLIEFGTRLGIALQMFDDLGNVSASNPKRYEDLVLRRPSWLWAVASALSLEDYDQFLVAVSKLPQDQELVDWLKKTEFLSRARAQAQHYLDRETRVLLGHWPDNPGRDLAAQWIQGVCETLKAAYG